MNKIDVLFLGPQKCGKSSLASRLIGKKWNDDKETSSAIELTRTIVTIEDGEEISISVWDTSGKQKHNALISNYFKYVASIIFVYDLTSIESFELTKQRIQEYIHLKNEDGNFVKKVIILVGNKLDLEKNRQVEITQGEKLAVTCDAYFCEASAKTNSNVPQIFSMLFNKAIICKRNNVVNCCCVL